MNSYVKLNGLLDGTFGIVFMKQDLICISLSYFRHPHTAPKKFYETSHPVWWPGLGFSAGTKSSELAHTTALLCPPSIFRKFAF